MMSSGCAESQGWREEGGGREGENGVETDSEGM